MENWFRNAAIFTFSAIGIGLGALVNTRFQLNHNGDAVMVAIGVFSAISASVSGVALLQAIRKLNVVGIFLTLIAFSISSGYNLQTALGIAANTRSDTVTSRTAASDSAGRLQWALGTYTNNRTEMAKAADGKAADVIQAELDGLQQDVAWTSTKGCTDATVPASRAYCAGYKTRQAQLAAARKVAELDGKIEAINQQLNTLHAVPGQTADPQASAVSFALSFIGIHTSDDGQVGKGLSLWFALLIWSFDSLGSVVAKLLFDPAPAPRSNAAAVEISAPAPAPCPKPKDATRGAPKRGAGHKKPSKAGQGAGGATILPFERRISKDDAEKMLREAGTQRAAAEKLGISPRTLRRILTA
jgi:hypothetical protein